MIAQPYGRTDGLSMTDETEFRRRVLALWRLPKVGPKRFALMQARDPSLDAFFQRSVARADRFSELLASFFPAGTILPEPDWRGVERDLAWAQAPDQHILIRGEPLYPSVLAQIAAPPTVLFVRGSLAVLAAQHIAMVGSRHPTRTGLQAAFSFAQGLAQAGWVITSGLAMGIDTACHQGALSAPQGRTVGVLACGLDRTYPLRNQALAQQMIDHGGCLVSEYPLGVPPLAEHFPRRNRIISGLSVGVVVVEAALKSGSLITAQEALDQGREVFALPGSVFNVQNEGGHRLIQQGAKLIMAVDDILEEIRGARCVNGLNGLVGHRSEPLENPYEGEQGAVWQAVDAECTPTDVVVNRTGLPIGRVGQYLLELTLEGALDVVPGGYARRAG